MIVTYDPFLVLLSVLIAICGGYTCFHMMDRLTRLYGASWKSTILAAAFAIGGGIWSMHFVGMLAMNMPDSVSYSLQETLLSALIAIGVTAIALYLVTFRKATAPDGTQRYSAWCWNQRHALRGYGGDPGELYR